MSPRFVPDLPRENCDQVWRLLPGTHRQKMIVIFLALTPIPVPEFIRLALLPHLSYTAPMKSLTIRLPDSLVADIEGESRARSVSRSEVVRERLRQPTRAAAAETSMRALIGDLIGSVRNDGLPTDLSSNKKK